MTCPPCRSPGGRRPARCGVSPALRDLSVHVRARIGRRGPRRRVRGGPVLPEAGVVVEVVAAPLAAGVSSVAPTTPPVTSSRQRAPRQVIPCVRCSSRSPLSCRCDVPRVGSQQSVIRRPEPYLGFGEDECKFRLSSACGPRSGLRCEVAFAVTAPIGARKHWGCTLAGMADPHDQTPKRKRPTRTAQRATVDPTWFDERDRAGRGAGPRLLRQHAVSAFGIVPETKPCPAEPGARGSNSLRATRRSSTASRSTTRTEATVAVCERSARGPMCTSPRPSRRRRHACSCNRNVFARFLSIGRAIVGR